MELFFFFFFSVWRELQALDSPTELQTRVSPSGCWCICSWHTTPSPQWSWSGQQCAQVCICRKWSSMSFQDVQLSRGWWLSLGHSSLFPLCGWTAGRWLTLLLCSSRVPLCNSRLKHLELVLQWLNRKLTFHTTDNQIQICWQLIIPQSCRWT